VNLKYIKMTKQKLQNTIILVALKNLLIEFKDRDQDQPLKKELKKLIQIYSKIS
jgi:hypothetical protein